MADGAQGAAIAAVLGRANTSEQKASALGEAFLLDDEAMAVLKELLEGYELKKYKGTG